VRGGLEICAGFLPSDALTGWHLRGTGRCLSRSLLRVALEVVPKAIPDDAACRRTE
jgi:hypothetical protein